MTLHTHRFETDPAPEPDEGDRIGIMADSHGDAGLIAAAAKRLREKGCQRLFHLGDICDTARPHSVAACLAQLETHRISAVRGNNEHTLLLDRPAAVATQTLTTIAAMPLSRRVGPALLVHSLPDTPALGPRCLIEALSTDHIRSFFRRYPGIVLIRGHSHGPEIVRSESASFSREAMVPGQPYKFSPGESAVITCGALIEGFSLVWDQRRKAATSVTRHAGTA